MDRVPINSNERPTPSSSRDRASILILFLLLFFGMGIFTFFFPTVSSIQRIEALPQVCPLRRFTGLKCAFCGMTHAWIYFWHGEWSEAFRENHLAPPLFFGAPFFSLISVFSANFRRLWTSAHEKGLVWISLTTLVLYTVLRNIPN